MITIRKKSGPGYDEGDNLSAPRLNIQIDIPDGMEAAAYAALHKATEEIAQQLAALAGMPLSLTEGDTQ